MPEGLKYFEATSSMNHKLSSINLVEEPFLPLTVHEITKFVYRAKRVAVVNMTLQIFKFSKFYHCTNPHIHLVLIVIIML